MNEQTIKSKLDDLAELQAMKDVAMMEKQELIDSILTPELKAEIAAIDLEFAQRTEVVTGKIADMEAEIKDGIIKLGQSVKGEVYHAVWAKPRVSWDTRRLDGYAAAHPEIAAFRKVGEPTCSIRIAK